MENKITAKELKDYFQVRDNDQVLEYFKSIGKETVRETDPEKMNKMLKENTGATRQQILNFSKVRDWQKSEIALSEAGIIN